MENEKKVAKKRDYGACKDRFQSIGLGQVTLARESNSRVSQHLGVLEGQEAVLPAVCQCSSEGDDASSRPGLQANELPLSNLTNLTASSGCSSKNPLMILTASPQSILQGAIME